MLWLLLVLIMLCVVCDSVNAVGILNCENVVRGVATVVTVFIEDTDNCRNTFDVVGLMKIHLRDRFNYPWRHHAAEFHTTVVEADKCFNEKLY